MAASQLAFDGRPLWADPEHPGKGWGFAMTVVMRVLDRLDEEASSATIRAALGPAWRQRNHRFAPASASMLSAMNASARDELPTEESAQYRRPSPGTGQTQDCGYEKSHFNRRYRPTSWHVDNSNAPAQIKNIPNEVS
jgi:hypothetical protein